MEPTPPLGFDDVRALAEAWPEVSERLCFGTPALFVRKVLLARLREDGRTLAIKCDLAEREFLLEARPDLFFITDHYLRSALVLVNLDLIGRAELAGLIERAWRMVAPRRLLRDHPAAAG
ncbi:MAG TPA: MmcQ/YjbR family DNA-binding protein [Herpetosiphonaceae bacterium]|nr:MmcQ/YjbR family DNA-binding protein [Herpetosiphonaceae bacterium]